MACQTGLLGDEHFFVASLFKMNDVIIMIIITTTIIIIIISEFV